MCTNVLVIQRCRCLTNRYEPCDVRINGDHFHIEVRKISEEMIEWGSHDTRIHSDTDVAFVLMTLYNKIDWPQQHIGINIGERHFLLYYLQTWQ